MTRPVITYEWTMERDGEGHPCKKKESGTGNFHGWGCDFKYGGRNYSTAIIEKPNGEVFNLPIELIKFTDVLSSSEVKIPPTTEDRLPG